MNLTKFSSALKRGLLFASAIFVFHFTQAQTTVGIGTENPNPAAVLELVSPSNDQGFLVPRLTTSQRSALSFTNDENGMLVFDSDAGKFYYWLNGTWEEVSGLTFTAGDGIDISSGTITNTGDKDETNEIQDLNLSGHDLSITNNGSATIIDLSVYLQDALSVVVTPSGNLTSTDVQNALLELQAKIDVAAGDMTKATYDINDDGVVDQASDATTVTGFTVQTAVPASADFTDDQTAGDVTVTPSGNLTSLNVQNALQELQTEIDAATGDMTKATYDINDDGVVDQAENAATVSGLTVQTAVPAGADFTDDQTAGDVTVTPSGNLTAINAQGALDELQSDIDIANTNISTNNTLITGKADLNSPVFTGTPTAPTPAGADNSTKIATTAYVQGELAGIAIDDADADPTNEIQDASQVGFTGPITDLSAVDVEGAVTELQSEITGNNTVLTANASNIANNTTALIGKADLNSPVFTGTPTAPTPAGADNSSNIATTAYVQGELAGISSSVNVDGTTIMGDGDGTSLYIPNGAISGGLSGLIADGTITDDDISSVNVAKISGLSPVASTGFINDLNDVFVMVPSNGQFLRFDGSNWGNATLNFSSVSGSIDGTQITDEGVHSADIADGAVTGGTGIGADIAANTITNDNISGSAAIQGSKVTPNFGSQPIITRSSLNLEDAVGSNSINLVAPASLIQNYSIELPHADGTVALVSDLSSAGPWTDNSGDIYYGSGNVGIGTTTPAEDLEIFGSGAYTSAQVTNNNSTGFASYDLLNDAGTEFELRLGGSAEENVPDAFYIEDPSSTTFPLIIESSPATGNAGDIVISASDGKTTGTGGNIYLQPGIGTSGQEDGAVVVPGNIDIGPDAHILNIAGDLAISDNIDFDGNGNPVYTQSSRAMLAAISSDGGNFQIFSAPNGVAGTTAPMNELMTIQDDISYVTTRWLARGGLIAGGNGVNSSYLAFGDADYSDSVAFRVPDILEQSTTYTLPSTDGSGGNVLTTDGAGTLSWNSVNSSQWANNGANIFFNSGNVGVGNSAPRSALQISDDLHLFHFDNGAGIEGEIIAENIYPSGADLRYTKADTAAMMFMSNGTFEFMRANNGVVDGSAMGDLQTILRLENTRDVRFYGAAELGEVRGTPSDGQIQFFGGKIQGREEGVWKDLTGLSFPVSENAAYGSNMLDLTNTGFNGVGRFAVDNTSSTESVLSINTNAQNTNARGITVSHTGTGTAGEFSITGGLGSTTQYAVLGKTDGLGSAGRFESSNASNVEPALLGRITLGAGAAVEGYTAGDGAAGKFTVDNATNSTTALRVEHTGTGTVAQFQNTGNSTSPAVSITDNGSVAALDIQSGGNTTRFGQHALIAGNLSLGHIGAASATLDVSGNIETDGDYTYAAPVTKYLTIPHVSFAGSGLSSGGANIIARHSSTFTGLYNPGGTTTSNAEMMAPVQLPDAATITNLQAQVSSGSAPNEVTVTLYRKSLSGPVEKIIEIAGVGTSGSTLVSDNVIITAGSNVINNGSYQYWIVFTGRANGETLESYTAGMRITYQVTKAD